MYLMWLLAIHLVLCVIIGTRVCLTPTLTLKTKLKLLLIALLLPVFGSILSFAISRKMEFGNTDSGWYFSGSTDSPGDGGGDGGGAGGE
ncbi:hypothetical protein [Pseudoalteromonas rubra]|uniref:hypothetical protein n=1 Tax=Pseudoalteromonas rubra TaxID=43658 RepID=UPI000F7682D0|nr:hypothetical protein [Pseudoalteromonas rubra]